MSGSPTGSVAAWRSSTTASRSGGHDVRERQNPRGQSLVDTLAREERADLISQEATGVTRSRFYLDGESELQFLDWARLEDDCKNLRDFYQILDQIVGGDCPSFYLPQTPDEPVVPALSVRACAPSNALCLH